MKPKIVVRLGKIRVEVHDPDDLPQVLSQLGLKGASQVFEKSSAAERSGDEDLYVALRMVHNSHPKPLPSRDLASAMGLKTATGMWATIDRWRNSAKAHGFQLEELMVPQKLRDRRVWIAGPKIAAGIRLLESGRSG